MAVKANIGKLIGTDQVLTGIKRFFFFFKSLCDICVEDRRGLHFQEKSHGGVECQKLRGAVTSEGGKAVSEVVCVLAYLW